MIKDKAKIDIDPKIKPHGYLELSLKHNTKDKENFLKKMENLKHSYQDDINKKEFNDFNIIYKSYAKIKKRIKLDKADYILDQNEINESKVYEGKKLLRYIVYRYKYYVYPLIYKIDDYPPCLQIEPTSICNFRCVMCYQSDKSFSSKSNGFMSYMNMDLFKKIIDEIEGKIEAVTFASRGEPTLHRFLPEMLDYCYGKFLGLKINTNASMLNEKMIHSMLSSDLQTIVFSIDAADKETYEKIRVNGKFEYIIKNLKLFKKIREKNYSKSKHIVKISGVKILKNQNINDVNKFWNDYADATAFVPYTPWQSSYSNPVNNHKHPCEELWQRMFVWADGKINPCDYDYKSYLSRNNAINETISEAWNSKAYNELRNTHLNKNRIKEEPCKRCLR